MNAENIRALREAGQVKRGHTVPYIGHYDIAQHTWQAVMLLYCLHPNPSPNLIKAVMFHDVGERYVGDLPAPVKWASAKLADIHGELELRAVKALGVDIELTDDEVAWAKAVDALEFYLWCEDQAAFGNRHIYRARERIQSWFVRYQSSIPPEVSSFVNTFDWDRSHEQLPL